MVWITGPVLDALASCEGLPTRKCLHADVDLGMFGVLDVHLVPTEGVTERRVDAAQAPRSRPAYSTQDVLHSDWVQRGLSQLLGARCAPRWTR